MDCLGALYLDRWDEGRKDGLIFKREDLGEDGMHPSPSGRDKVATLLMDFLKNDPTAKIWFVKF
jgi:lysophospholipase L1-like esterase